MCGMLSNRECREKEFAEEQQLLEAEREHKHRRLEVERTEECCKYEEENSQRFHAMAKQMELLNDMVSTVCTEKKETEPIKLKRLTDSDDIELHLTTFERMMQAYKVDGSRWALKLAPELTGQALQAYASMDPSDAECYDSGKSAILRRFNINNQTYRQRFRNLKSKAGQTQTDIAARLTDLASRWLKDCTTIDQVNDAVVKEQLITTFSEAFDNG